MLDVHIVLTKVGHWETGKAYDIEINKDYLVEPSESEDLHKNIFASLRCNGEAEESCTQKYGCGVSTPQLFCTLI
jgi:hypothetical protein